MRSEATRVLVTGGAGFIGSHLVRALVGAGHGVRVLDNFATGRRDRLIGVAVEVIDDDVRNPAAVRRAIDGVEVVFHLAGVEVPPAEAPTRDLRGSIEVNVGGTLLVLQAAAAVRARRVVIAGSGAVYGTAAPYVLHEDVAPAPSTAEAVQRLSIEHFARLFREQHGVPAVVLRLFRCFGPGEAWSPPPGARPHLVPMLCRAALRGQSPMLVGDGRQTRDLVYVDNAVAGLVAAGSVRGPDAGVYNIASGEAVSLQAAWHLVAQLAGYRHDPPEPAFVPAPRHEPPHVRVSIARASRDLGYAPAVLLREGLRRTLDYYREELRSSDNGWFLPPDPPPEAYVAARHGGVAGRLQRESSTHSPSVAPWWSAAEAARSAGEHVTTWTFEEGDADDLLPRDEEEDDDDNGTEIEIELDVADVLVEEERPATRPAATEAGEAGAAVA
jgi:nucleoside-diphosphate-sugar epimerase